MVYVNLVLFFLLLFLEKVGLNFILMYDVVG